MVRKKEKPADRDGRLRKRGSDHRAAIDPSHIPDSILPQVQRLISSGLIGADGGARQ